MTLKLQDRSEILSVIGHHTLLLHTVAAGRGASAPGGTVQGAAFGGSKTELWNFAASGKLILALQIVIIYPLMSPYSPPVLGLHPNCKCSTTPYKVVCTPRNLHCWPDWSFPCCKTIENPYCPVTILLAIASQCFALFTCFHILHKIWEFCMKFGQSILSNLLQPDVRF